MLASTTQIFICWLLLTIRYIFLNQVSSLHKQNNVSEALWSLDHRALINLRLIMTDFTCIFYLIRYILLLIYVLSVYELLSTFIILASSNLKHKVNVFMLLN